MPVRRKPFSVKQLKAIELIGMGMYTTAEISKLVGTADNTIRKWKLLEGFMEEVLESAKKHLKSQVPEVYEALSKKSKKGHDRHIKIFLDHLEKLEGIRASRANITFTWEAPTQVLTRVTVETNEEEGED